MSVSGGLRARVNRRVNCETANIAKTVEAASRQLDDIEYLDTHGGLLALPKALSEIAMLRAEHPELALEELGTLCNPPVGKSGVNHRFRRLHNIREESERNGQD